MGPLKSFLTIFAFLFLNAILNGQSASYSEITKAFQSSYLNEATGKLDDSSKDLKKIYDEDSYEINLRLGWLTYSLGQFSESASYYRRAVELKPYAIEPRFGLIYPTAAMGNWNTVIQQYDKILELAPGNTIAMHRLGLVYYGQKEYLKAEKLFQKVVDLYPFDYDGLLMLAWTNLQLKKYREAKVLFNKALMHTPAGQSALEGLELLE